MKQEAAEKERVKANELYDKKIHNLTLRTQPFGHDRHHNAYYHIHNDPKMIHVEINRSPHDDIQKVKSWHCIDHRPLFDNFISSLDNRGIRENELLEKLTGDHSTNIRKLLVDTTKKKDIFAAREREEEELERRLTNAMIANAEQGRRSGRLAGVAEVSY